MTRPDHPDGAVGKHSYIIELLIKCRSVGESEQPVRTDLVDEQVGRRCADRGALEGHDAIRDAGVALRTRERELRVHPTRQRLQVNVAAVN